MNKLKVSLLGLSLITFGFDAMAATQVLTLNERARLTASIAIDAMNRLAVANDRIVNLFGDEGTFMTQNDEQTGQVFIKPTIENQEKPLSLTLVTENGLTQDLNLISDALEASTLILKSGTTSVYSSFQDASPQALKASNTVDRAVQLLKQAMLRQLPSHKESVHARKCTDFQMQYQNSFVVEGFSVQHWVIQNTGRQSQELLEKNLYERGDIALSLDKHWLGPREKGDVYILRVEVPHA